MTLSPARPRKAEISRGRLILPCVSFKSEVEFEVVEPWDVGINAFLRKLLRKMFVVSSKLLSPGSVVEGDKNGVVRNAEIAIYSVEKALGHVSRIPVADGFMQALA